MVKLVKCTNCKGGNVAAVYRALMIPTRLRRSWRSLYAQLHGEIPRVVSIGAGGRGLGVSDNLIRAKLLPSHLRSLKNPRLAAGGLDSSPALG